MFLFANTSSVSDYKPLKIIWLVCDLFNDALLIQQPLYLARICKVFQTRNYLTERWKWNEWCILDKASSKYLYYVILLRWQASVVNFLLYVIIRVFLMTNLEYCHWCKLTWRPIVQWDVEYPTFLGNSLTDGGDVGFSAGLALPTGRFIESITEP
jgi:hypothetical protein